MIFVYALLLSGAFLQVFAAPDLSHALAKVSEAKARAQANREKLKANTEQIVSRIRASIPNRSKRQHGLDYSQTYPPPTNPNSYAPPPYVPPPPYEEEEPTLVHICSAEDEYGYSRSAEDREEDEQLDVFVPEHNTQKFKVEGNEEAIKDNTPTDEFETRNSNHFDSTLQASSPHFHSLHHHHSHGHILPPIHGQGFHQPLSPGLIPNLNVNVNQNQNLHSNVGPSSQFPLHGGFQTGRHISPHQTAVISDHHIFNPRASGGHLIIPHQPINHRQFSHQTPFTLGSSHTLENSNDETLKAEQNDEGKENCEDSDFQLREAEQSNKAADDNIVDVVGSPTFKKKKDKGQQYIFVPIYNQRPQYYGNSYGRYREAENLDEKSENLMAGNPDNQSDTDETHNDATDETVGSPTFKKKDKEPRIIIVPIYNQNPPPYYSQGYGQYREAENSEQNTDNLMASAPETQEAQQDPQNDTTEETVGSPTFKKKDKEPRIIVVPIYNQNPPPYYSQGYGQYREAENTEDKTENLMVSAPEMQETSVNSKKDIIIKAENVKDESENLGAPPIQMQQIETTDETVGSPSFKKKDKQPQIIVIPIYNQRPYYAQSYGDYREAENSEDKPETLMVQAENPETQELQENDLDETVGDPTFKKKKNKHQQYVYVPTYNQRPQHYANTYSRYREAKDVNDQQDLINAPSDRQHAEQTGDMDVTVGSPTFKKKKDEQPQIIFLPIYDQKSPYYSTGYGQYREADNFENQPEDPTDIREADPSHKRKPKRPKHGGHFREAEETTDTEQRNSDNLDPEVSSNFLLNFPQTRRFSDQYKRSADEELDAILGEEREIVNALGDRPEKDEDLKFITDLSNRTLTDLEEKRKNITKRSLPLTRLISDPNVKLDVPQTIDNFGTAAKYSFEDERAPMHHFKNMLGSSRNALLSAMRIPPHNMIIPSDYEIVKSSELVGSARDNPVDDDKDPFSQTFKKVGHMVRQGVRSGHETLTHVGDAAHSARNILNSARHAAPKLIIPYSQIPAIQDTRRKKPSKAILITPRLLDLAEETAARRSEEIKPNLVRLGHLMDAVGVSKPGSKNLDLQKIIFEPRKLSQAKADERLVQLYSKFREDYDNVDTVNEAISTLEDAKISVGAKNLRDFLSKMKGELSDFVLNKPPKHIKKKVKSEKKKQETKEMGMFIENLFDGSKQQPKNGPASKNENQKEIVGEGLNLPPELLHPFMGRPSNTDLNNFFKDNGDENVIKELHKALRHGGKTESHSTATNEDLGHVLGAVNPLMFERIYNETVRVKNKDTGTPEDTFQMDNQGNHDRDNNGTVGTSFTMTEPLLKPFMGRAPPQQVAELLETYNGDETRDFIDYDNE